MLRKLLILSAAVLVLTLITGGVLYQFFGMRIVPRGRIPEIEFVELPEAQAERVRRHRDAQRAQAVGASENAATTRPAEPIPVEPSDGEERAVRAPATTPATPLRAKPYWTDFRGPLRDGVYREQTIRTDLNAALTPLWKQPAGGGYASFVVAHGRAFTIEQRGREEVVAAYDVATGRELWTNAWAAEFRESMGGDGPRATPTWHEGHVYALGATGEFRVLDEASGKVRWRTNILTDNGAQNLDWGMAAAPLVVGDVVVVVPGGPNGRSVVAYDRLSGVRKWSALSDQAAYVSPMLVTLGGVQQILVFTATRLVAIPLSGGEPLWEYPWRSEYGINAAQPILLDGNRIFVSSSYAGAGAVVEVTGGPDGFTVREVWRNNRMKNQFSSSVVHQGTIYGLDMSILAAIDATTGELKWKGGRYGTGQLVLVGDRLIVLTEDGDLAVVNATPERHEELTRFAVLDGKTWNVPAISGGYLLIRNLAEMAAFDLRTSR
jgi:outer membrane protein assembly factor BamB